MVEQLDAMLGVFEVRLDARGLVRLDELIPPSQATWSEAWV